MDNINFTLAEKLATPTCDECGGTGWKYNGEYDNRTAVYCICVKEKVAQGKNEPEQ